jgi:hypothetical protein
MILIYTPPNKYILLIQHVGMDFPLKWEGFNSGEKRVNIIHLLVGVS